AIKRLLIRESLLQPVLLVFEDLHWIDAETQALLDRLVGKRGAYRLAHPLDRLQVAATVQAIADVPEEALHQGLTRLQAAEFLYEARLFPELEYTFKHALTHEVAYGSLLQERRRALHARIVEAIEGLYANHLTDQVEQLAHHAVRSEVWDKALAYCRQAGEK